MNENMKKLLLSLITIAALVSCTDTLQKDLDDLSSRVSNLEERVGKLETNLTSLTSLVNATITGDMITSCTPIKNGDKITGYTISFSKGESITIYNGSEISVKQDTDGEYYWAIGDQFVIVDGKKVPVSGQTPKIKIEDGNWLVSYDDGKTWEELGSATTSDLIKEINESAIMYEFVLSNGTSISVAKEGCGIDFSPVNLYFTLGQVNSKVYELETSLKTSGCYYFLESDLVGEDGVRCYTQIHHGDVKSEYYTAVLNIYITEQVCNPFTMRIRVFKQKSGEDEITFIGEKELHFQPAVAEAYSNGKYIYKSSEAGLVKCLYTSNFLGTSLAVPEEFSDWISIDQTKSLLFSENLSLTQNTSTNPRVGYVNIMNTASENIITRIYVIQEGTSEFVSFEDAKVESVLVGYCDRNSDGKISCEEAVWANNNWFTAYYTETSVFQNTSIESFPEIVYFPEILNRPGAFNGCSSLTAITYPDYVAYTSVPNNCFKGCTSLSMVALPKGISDIGVSAFENSGVETVTFTKTIGNIGDNAFKNCTNLEAFKYVDDTNGDQYIIETIGENAFMNCGKLTDVEVSAKTLIGKCAFMNTGDVKANGNKEYVVIAKKVEDLAFANSKISGVMLGTNFILNGVKQYPVEVIGNHVFTGCENLNTVYCWFEPPTIGAFSSSRKVKTLYYNLGWERYVALGLDQLFEECVVSAIIELN